MSAYRVSVITLNDQMPLGIDPVDYYVESRAIDEAKKLSMMWGLGFAVTVDRLDDAGPKRRKTFRRGFPYSEQQQLPL